MARHQMIPGTDKTECQMLKLSRKRQAPEGKGQASQERATRTTTEILPEERTSKQKNCICIYMHTSFNMAE
ncbi:uncharacterized protein PADG_11181 [Paracoccidioides brasiliensis Pb18]|uniref:Uncharacterized protein n=1 Tax=Paracoccidioides brasiliensis (strain Pb18) TaxID=502780 RepID=A0A0A0HWK1_PARBD|nr:uncharacterized protein PADG_11181 [Paracoccidioides brasiliensis Pb18]KGM92723.1 hypothetical protein PADG_11181 [Paracoccidioides brasiliensis Pb18]